MEDQLLEVCNDIYNRHTKALDLIFKFKSSERSNVTKWISETLESLSNSNKEVVYNKGKGFSVKFRLKTIDDILMGAFPHDNITEIYFFAFKFKRGKKEIRIRWHKTKNIDSNRIKVLSTVGVAAGMPFLKLILCFAYVDGSLSDDIAEKLEQIFGLILSAAYLMCDME